MGDDEPTGNWWRETFGTEPPTDDERTLRKEKERWQRNERYRAIFERDQSRRQERSYLDDRVRSIAAFEATKAVIVMGGVGLGVYLMQKEVWQGVAMFALATGWVYWQEREQKKKFDYKAAILDDLAEATVQHERIVELETANIPWLTHSKYVDVVNVFADPYWQKVTEKTATFQRMSHANRVKALKVATTASLPFRQTMLQRIRAHDPEADLPNWAKERNDDRSWM